MNQLDFEHVYQPGASPDATMLILLHGTGGDENDLVPVASDLLPQAAILSPRGQVSEGGALRFFRRSSVGVLDIEDWRKRSKQLAEFIAAAAREYKFNLRHTFAVGLSNGANVATGLLLLRPDMLAGAVLWRPMFVADVFPRPDLSGKEVLIQAGTMDPLLPPGDTERLRDQLADAGAKVTVRFQVAGHNLTQKDVAEAGEWLRAKEMA